VRSIIIPPSRYNHRFNSAHRSPVTHLLFL
jgi:hypothetical protein